MFINLLWSRQFLRFARALMFLTFDQLQKNWLRIPLLLHFKATQFNQSAHLALFRHNVILYATSYLMSIIFAVVVFVNLY